MVVCDYPPCLRPRASPANAVSPVEPFESMGREVKAEFLEQDVAPLTKTQEALVLQSLWVFHEVADLLWVLSPTMMWLGPWLGGPPEVHPVPRHQPD